MYVFLHQSSRKRFIGMLNVNTIVTANTKREINVVVFLRLRKFVKRIPYKRLVKTLDYKNNVYLMKSIEFFSYDGKTLFFSVFIKCFIEF